jgi:hypothetical protein
MNGKLYWGLIIVGFIIGLIGYVKIHNYDIYGLGIAIMFYTIGFFNGRKKNNKEEKK